MGSGNSLLNPGTRPRLARELAEEPRASLNDFYNIIFRPSQLALIHPSNSQRNNTIHFIITQTKLPRPSRGGSPLLGNKKRRSPRETTTPEVLNFTTNYTKVFSLGRNYLSSDTYVLGACHLPWPSRFSGRYVLVRWCFLWAAAGARSCATQTFELFARRFFTIFDLLTCSHQQRRKKCPRVAAYIAPWAHVMLGTCRLPIGSLGLTSTQGSSVQAN